MNFDPAQMSLAAIARALRDGTVRAAALVEACIEKRDPSLDAYREWQPELAREQARKADAAFAQAKDLGTLQGIPVSVKDLYGVSQMDVFAGSPTALPPLWQTEGAVIGTLRAQH
ncbi:MAG: amidase, partial [Acidiferrobacteraceae bacterium]|nr:amidase [Acidiferrobacteraceae bacterium]